MRVVLLGAPIPLLTFGSSAGDTTTGAAGTVLTSSGSNTAYWGENIARITANGSNADTLIGPFVNISAGPGISLATASNTLTVTSTGAGITVKDEGVALLTDATSLDFVGAGVTASGTGAAKTITILASGGLLSSITAASAAIANTETVVVSAALAAGYLTAGMTFRIRAAGVGTTGLTPGVDTFRLRIGPTTLTGNIVTSVAPPANGSITNQPFSFEAILTIRAVGAGGTIIGECLAVGDDVATGLFTLIVDLSATVATSAVNTTVANLLELTFQSATAGSSCTFHVAEIEVLSVSGATGSTALVGCRLTNSGSQSVNSAALTALTFDTESYDTDALHSTSTNTSRITIPSGKAGKYIFGGSWRVAANATGYRRGGLVLNGATYQVLDSKLSVTAAETSDHTVVTMISLAAGDYMELWLEQTSGGARTVSDQLFWCEYRGA